MAQTSTTYNFEIELSDIDRGVYDSFSLAVAQHPSETSLYLLTRVLAYCLEKRDGLTFSHGLSESEEPALWGHDDTGKRTAWIEIGTPSPERIHRARKSCEYVAIYVHKEIAPYLALCRSSKIYKAEDILVYTLPQSVLTELEQVTEKRMRFSISRSEQVLYINHKQNSFHGLIEKYSL